MARSSERLRDQFFLLFIICCGRGPQEGIQANPFGEKLYLCGPSWGIPGATWRGLVGSSVPLGDRCGWSVAVLKPAWSGLGAGLGALGVVLGSLGAILDGLETVLCHWGGLGSSWGALGAFLVVLGMILGDLGAGLGRS